MITFGTRMLRILSLLLLFVFIQFISACSPSVEKPTTENKVEETQPDRDEQNVKGEPKTESGVRNSILVAENNTVDKGYKGDNQDGDNKRHKETIDFAKKDFEQQKRMADAAEDAVFVAKIATALSALGVWLLVKNIRESRKINDIAEQTLKHTRDTDSRINRAIIDTEVVFDLSNPKYVKADLVFRNKGNSLAYDFSFNVKEVVINKSGIKESFENVIVARTHIPESMLPDNGSGSDDHVSIVKLSVEKDRMANFRENFNCCNVLGTLKYRDDFCKEGMYRSVEITIINSSERIGKPRIFPVKINQLHRRVQVS